MSERFTYVLKVIREISLVQETYFLNNKSNDFCKDNTVKNILKDESIRQLFLVIRWTVT